MQGLRWDEAMAAHALPCLAICAHRQPQHTMPSRASSSYSDTSTLQAHLHCDICTEPFDEGAREPRVLPCGHTVCKQCLRRLEAELHPGLLLTCPMCREEVFASLESIPRNHQLLQGVRESATAPTTPTGHGSHHAGRSLFTSSGASTPRHGHSSLRQWVMRVVRDVCQTAPARSTSSRDPDMSLATINNRFSTAQQLLRSRRASDAGHESESVQEVPEVQVQEGGAGPGAGGSGADAAEQRTGETELYQGVSLSDWVERLNSGSWEEQLRAAQALAGYVGVCNFDHVSIRPLVLAGAAEALSRLVDRCSRHSFLRPLQSDNRQNTSWLLQAASRALQKLASAAPICCMDTMCTDAVPCLVRLLGVKDERTQQSAAKGLKDLIQASPGSCGDAAVQAGLLGAPGDSRGQLPVLISALHSPQTDVQFAAAEALTAITRNNPERMTKAAQLGAVPAMVKLLSNPNLQQRSDTKQAIEDFCAAVNPRDVRQQQQ